MNLPVHLTKNPLVNVVFEIRFDSTVPMSSVLPGLMYTHLHCTSIKKTPHADIPEIIRNQDPNFAYIPVVTMDWGNYQISIGDKVLLLSCNMPYLGWAAFSTTIRELISKFSETNFPIQVERFSLKYVDLLAYNVDDDLNKILDFNVQVGKGNLDLKLTQLRTEKHEGDIITIIQFLGQAEAQLSNGTNCFGMLIDIDCIKKIDNLDLSKLYENFDAEIDALHLKAKKEFFNFISKDGLEHLGASYA